MRQIKNLAYIEVRESDIRDTIANRYGGKVKEGGRRKERRGEGRKGKHGRKIQVRLESW